MRKILFASAITTCATPAFADAVTIKPIVDARLRYESVEQKSLANDAEAITARVRAGIEAKTGPITLLLESEATLALSERYNSGVNGKTEFPIVADPQNVELNRAQVQFAGIPKTLVTLGRQRINLDDQRFVGSVGFRDNEQTFDAARVEWSGIKNLKADVTYSWSQRSIWGVDGFGARQQAVRGDNMFATLSYKHKRGTVTGFAYLVDQDETAVAGYAMSSKTFGARFAGAAPLSKAIKLTYALSYARQRDFHRNPNRYNADYMFGEIGIEAKRVKLLGGYEVLGSDDGVALASFQTPYATLHKFNGWADKFLKTPANGLRDAYAALSYTKSKVGPFSSLALTTTYHAFKSDRLHVNYGEEIGAQMLATVRKTTFTLKYAHYNAHAFATNTTKLWASVEWAL